MLLERVLLRLTTVHAGPRKSTWWFEIKKRPKEVISGSLFLRAVLNSIFASVSAV